MAQLALAKFLVKYIARFELEALKARLTLYGSIGSGQSFTSEADKLEAGQTWEGVQKNQTEFASANNAA